LTGCSFTSNTSYGYVGGGYGGGIAAWNSSVTLEGCVFSENTAYKVGGAVSAMECVLAVRQCVFNDNLAASVGGVYCFRGTGTFTECTFSGNTAVGSDGGVALVECAPAFVDCTFSGNRADEHAGGMMLTESSPTVSRCTFWGNSSGCSGGGICAWEGSFPELANTIVAFSTDGEAVACHGASGASLTCCDVFGNADGDWVGCIADQYGVDGNISEDPLFCDPESGDFSLHVDSPCLPGNHPEGPGVCGLIGAWPVGCPPSEVADDSSIRSAVRLVPGRPNPFCSRTSLSYFLQQPGWVRLNVYDLLGRRVRTLVEEFSCPGQHVISWRGTSDSGILVAPGVYLLRLEAGGEVITGKIMLAR